MKLSVLLQVSGQAYIQSLYTFKDEEAAEPSSRQNCPVLQVSKSHAVFQPVGIRQGLFDLRYRYDVKILESQTVRDEVSGMEVGPESVTNIKTL